MAFQGDSIYWVEVSKIVPNPFQPRREFDQRTLQELAESIRMYGVLQPLTVTRKEIQNEDGTFYTKYELIAGERRLRASKLAGVSQVPVIIRSGEQSEQEKLEIAIIENLQREDLNAVDRALAFKQLATQFKLSHAQVAKKVGRSREYVSNSIRLLGLPEFILDALQRGEIMEGHARTLLMINDKPEEQNVIFREIVLKKMSVREVEKIVRKMAKDKVRKPRQGDFDERLLEFEKKFTETLGTRVQIQKTPFGGKLTIDYFSDDDLNKLLLLIKEDKNKKILTKREAEEEVSQHTPLVFSENSVSEDVGDEGYKKEFKEHFQNNSDHYSNVKDSEKNGLNSRTLQQISQQKSVYGDVDKFNVDGNRISNNHVNFVKAEADNKNSRSASVMSADEIISDKNSDSLSSQSLPQDSLPNLSNSGIVADNSKHLSSNFDKDVVVSEDNYHVKNDSDETQPQRQQVAGGDNFDYGEINDINSNNNDVSVSEKMTVNHEEDKIKNDDEKFSPIVKNETNDVSDNNLHNQTFLSSESGSSELNSGSDNNNHSRRFFDGGLRSNSYDDKFVVNKHSDSARESDGIYNYNKVKNSDNIKNDMEFNNSVPAAVDVSGDDSLYHRNDLSHNSQHIQVQDRYANSDNTNSQQSRNTRFVSNSNMVNEFERLTSEKQDLANDNIHKKKSDSLNSETSEGEDVEENNNNKINMVNKVNKSNHDNDDLYSIHNFDL